MARFDNWATARYVRNLGESGLRADITETALLIRSGSGAVCFAVMHGRARRYRITFAQKSMARRWRARSQQKRAPLRAADVAKDDTHIMGSALLPNPQEFELALRSPIMGRDQTRGPAICRGLRHRLLIWWLGRSR